jgi:damage-control phosphatase, subfamily I
MISDYRCFFCFARTFERLLEKEGLTREEKNIFTRKMVELYDNECDNFSAPVLSRELHIILNQMTKEEDSYSEIKKKSNDHIISLYPELKQRIQNSVDPFNTALRLAIAGNIMDYAISENFNVEATIKTALITDFAIDHSHELQQALLNADSVLYLGDNAGEIVFDKLFIEQINHPDIYFAVRGAAISNDATLDDGKYVGIDVVANLISNGYDAPSTIIDKCSDEFKEVFNKADVIISKGQGNLEGLLPLNDNRIFFLTMAKCDVIADFLKVPKNSSVIFNSALLIN